MVVNKAEFFYAEDGQIVSTNPVWFQREFYILIGIFKQVGLRNNVVKTLEMVCHTSTIASQHSVAAYEQSMTGEVEPLRAIQCQRFFC